MALQGEKMHAGRGVRHTRDCFHRTARHIDMDRVRRQAQMWSCSAVKMQLRGSRRSSNVVASKEGRSFLSVKVAGRLAPPRWIAHSAREYAHGEKSGHVLGAKLLRYACTTHEPTTSMYYTEAPTCALTITCIFPR